MARSKTSIRDAMRESQEVPADACSSCPGVMVRTGRTQSEGDGDYSRLYRCNGCGREEWC